MIRLLLSSAAMLGFASAAQADYVLHIQIGRAHV